MLPHKQVLSHKFPFKSFQCCPVLSWTCCFLVWFALCVFMLFEVWEAFVAAFFFFCVCLINKLDMTVGYAFFCLQDSVYRRMTSRGKRKKEVNCINALQISAQSNINYQLQKNMLHSTCWILTFILKVQTKHQRTRKVNNGVCVSVLMKSNAVSPAVVSV